MQRHLRTIPGCETQPLTKLDTSGIRRENQRPRLSVVGAAPFVRVKLAQTDWEREGVRHVRRAVFCAEQGLFDSDDGDAIDAHALPIVALRESEAGSEVIGTVRIHTSTAGVWHGSRLAVTQDARRIGTVGSNLIRMAVSTAMARGCHTFLAEVQYQNEPLFRRLKWQTLSVIEMYGLAHHIMRADLAYYSPNVGGELDLRNKLACS